VPNADRLWHIGEAFRRGMTVDDVAAQTRIDPWFLRHIEDLIATEAALADASWTASTSTRCGASSRMASPISGWRRCSACQRRTCGRAASGSGVRPVYKTVDTCGRRVRGLHAVPLLHLRAGRLRGAPDGAPEDRHPGRRPEPHRAGHRVRLLLRAQRARAREDGFETIMVNCNPETVSTDYDTSDKLFFEPLTLEDVLAIVQRERPEG
jgi:carbamoyl-phosphate synthase large subunit